jgi:hypothetical protein
MGMPWLSLDAGSAHEISIKICYWTYTLKPRPKASVGACRRHLLISRTPVLTKLLSSPRSPHVGTNSRTCIVVDSNGFWRWRITLGITKFLEFVHRFRNVVFSNFLDPRTMDTFQKLSNSEFHCSVSLYNMFLSFSWDLILIRSVCLVLKTHFYPWIRLASCIFYLNFNLLKISSVYNIK